MANDQAVLGKVGYFPLDSLENRDAYETLVQLLPSSAAEERTTTTTSTRSDGDGEGSEQIVFNVRADQIDKKWISVEHRDAMCVLKGGIGEAKLCLPVVQDGHSNILVRDGPLLASLKWLIGRNLIFVEIVLHEMGFIPAQGDMSGVQGHVHNRDIPHFRIDIAFTQELIDSSRCVAQKEVQHIQKLVQIIDTFPYYEYPEGLHRSFGRSSKLDNFFLTKEQAGSNLRDNIFNVIKPSDWQKEYQDPAGLKCSLYKYQKRALAWMLHRESGQTDDDFVDGSSVRAECAPSIRYIPVVMKNSILYFEYFSGRFVSESECDVQFAPAGGLLCDEMGLGKTVEIIALVLASKQAESIHRKTKKEHGKLSGGTLVVCPPALLQQWASELQNHAGGSLKVEVYDGIRSELDREEKRKREESDLTVSQEGMQKSVDHFLAGLSRSKYGALTEAMVREAQMYAARAAGQPQPCEDPSEVVLKEARRIAVADVVLTSFDVLKSEIHYDSSKNDRPLRNAKRYLVPDCALLKIDFFRMVADEAQMIGSFSQVSQMTDKILAHNRWCVTGTPMQSSNELSDLKALLSFLGMVDMRFDTVWRKMVVSGLKSPSSTQHARQSSWARLVKLLLPVMWRTDKMTVRTEFSLPPRSLHFVPLKLQPGESELYSQLVEKARQAHTSLEVAVESLQVVMEHDTAATKKAFEKRLHKLQEEEKSSLHQLRLACIHPQLTKFWRQEMAGDLQLGSGGTTSMAEVLQRLVDKEQGDLQEMERLLCAHLNTTAMRLLDKLKKKRKPSRGETDVPNSPGENVPSPEKYFASSSPGEILHEAQQMLIKSQNVSEKGIRAVDLSAEDAAKLPDPDALAASSWSAWRRIQINTAEQMLRVLRKTDENHPEIQKYEEEREKRASDYIGNARSEHEHAMTHEAKLLEQELKLKHEVLQIAQYPNIRIFDTWSAISDVRTWWKTFETNLNHLRLQELEELNHQQSTTEKALGTVVIAHLSETEKVVRSDLVPLESFISRAKIEEAIRTLQSKLDTLESIDWATENASAVPMRDFRYTLARMANLLTVFKRDTILNQFSQVLPVPREAKVAATAEQVGTDITIDNILLEESLGFSKPRDADDPAILEGASCHAEFLPADSWIGRVKGYAFFNGELGLGYYIDKKLEAAHETPIKYLINQCATKILHELQQRCKVLSKTISAENEHFLKKCHMDAVEARFKVTSKILEFLRLLRDRHTSSATVRLKKSILNDIEVDVEKAATEYPIKNLKQIDKLLKKVEEYKEAAQDLQHKKAFMANRLNEVDGNASVTIKKDESDAMKKETIVQENSFGPAKVETKSPGVECPVCMADVDGDLCLWSSCGHAFCRECSDHLFRGTKSAVCPICRAKCSHRHVLRVAAHTRNRHGSPDNDLDPTGAEDPIISTVSTNSDWSIKISALVRRLLALKISAPHEKSLVFSQFTDALKVVSLALKAHEIPHVHLYGRSKDAGHAIQSFRENEDIKVFLIAQKAGAQGLTLVRANHVFLLEPSIDPAIEQQAISRVHRIGQQRDVHIVRLIVGGTIEEQVLHLQKKRQDLFSEEQQDHSMNDTHSSSAGEEEDNLLGQGDEEAATTLAGNVSSETLRQHEIDSLLHAVLRAPQVCRTLPTGKFSSKAFIQTPTKQFGSRRFERAAMHSTPKGGSILSEILPDIIYAREGLRLNLPMETFRVAGVTFDDRQALLQNLRPNTAVVLEKEPENRYDPNAVAVKLLNDEKLGYIPKQQTGAFIHQICFGRIKSVGQVSTGNGNWGCLLDTQPHLPPVIPLAIPGDLLSDCKNLVHTLKGEAWETYRDGMAQRMNYRCSITGASTSSVEARWRILEGDKVVRLVGFAVQDTLISLIQYLDVGTTLTERDFVQVLEDLNDLTTEEAAEIMSRQFEFSEIRRDSGWTLDVSYLKTLGL